MKACFVTTIDLKLADKLRADLEQQGFELSKPPYTLFAAKKSAISCTLYTSGKLTVQGKGKEEFIQFYLEPEILGNLSYSYPQADADLTPHIGGDEAGKGDFFGPLCIAAVYTDDIPALIKLGAQDSKKMGDKNIHILAKKIKSSCPHAIVRISPLKYNELYDKFRNLNHLLAWAHATAIAELVSKTGCDQVLIDQFANESLVKNALKQKQVAVKLTQRPRAEEDPVVAAASILARDAFVEGIDALGKALDFTLPKGASNQVIQAGKALVSKHGEEILKTVAKLHFKTKDLILHSF